MSKKPQITADQYNSLYQLYEQSQKQIQEMTSGFEKEKQEFENEKTKLQKFLNSPNIAVVDLTEIKNSIEEVKFDTIETSYNNYGLRLNTEPKLTFSSILDKYDYTYDFLGNTRYSQKIILPNSFKKIINELKKENKKVIDEISRDYNNIQKENDRVNKEYSTINASLKVKNAAIQSEKSLWVVLTIVFAISAIISALS